MLAVVLLLAGCTNVPAAKDAKVGGDGPAVEAVRVLTGQVATQRISPLSASRVYGYSLWAGWSANRNGLSDDSAAWVTAEVASVLLENRFPAKEFDAFQLRRPVRPDEKTVADEIVTAVLEVASADGESAGPGPWERREGELMWRPTGTGMPGLDPRWGELVTIVPGSKTCELPPPDLALVKQEAAEMLRTFDPNGANSDITLWWLAGNATPTPAGQWLNIISNYLVDNKVPSATAWDILGHAGVAAFDVSIRLWNQKYKHNLIRPESLWFDLVGDRAPLLRRETPNHPSYPSGHSGFSAASAAVLVGVLGVPTVAVRDNLPVDVIVPPQVRAWDDVWAAVDEAGRSRVVSGFHFPLDISAGNTLGRCVAGQVLDGLQPIGLEKGSRS